MEGKPAASLAARAASSAASLGTTAYAADIYRTTAPDGTVIYSDIDAYGWFWYLASVPVYLFLHDTYFYWTHRMMHHPRVFPVESAPRRPLALLPSDAIPARCGFVR